MNYNSNPPSSQAQEFSSYPRCVQNWCANNWLYKGKEKRFSHPSSLTPLTPSKFIHTILNGLHVGLYTKNSNVICVDIDSKEIADLFILMVKQLNVLIIRTPRGGIHAYFHKPKVDDSVIFGNTYKVTQIGLIIEFKSESMVTTLGTGYSIISSPDNENLSELPQYLYPLRWFPKHYQFKSVPLIQDETIKQGNRNNHLFSWSCFMFRNEDEFVSSRDEVINVLANYFCDPPIKDEEEIHNLVHVENRIELKGSKVVAADSLDVPVWVDYIFSKWGKIKFRFHNSEQTWYKYCEEDLCWKEISDTMFQFYVCKEFENYKVSNSLRKMNFLTNFSRLFALYVLVDDDEIRLIDGISFLNGFLNLRTLKLEAHNPERFTTSTLQVHYNEFKEIETIYKQLLTIFVSNNPLYLNHLRGFLKRAFILEPACQTILLISGSPGSGKSTFIQFLSTIFGHLLFSFDVRGKNQFSALLLLI